MPKPEKIEAVAELKERLKSHIVAIATQYKGVTVEQVTELRRKLRAEGVEFKVYKNTLVKRALDELGIAGGAGLLEGPTAWAFSKDPVTPAKIIRNFAKEVKVIAMNGGILEGRAITKAQVETLATLPPKDVLVAQVIGTIAAPLRNFLGVLTGVPRNLVNVLDQIRKQKEEAAAA
ncbi:MAG: 50S ribosomal protein L10 [Candidatus Hydrogenedentes bacterium]|nr:50S ribosomal protein L10 [Candidatus Hydrogenedentota bacterium]